MDSKQDSDNFPGNEIARSFLTASIIFFITVSLIIMTGKTQAQDAARTQAYSDLSHESDVFGHTKYFRIYFPQGYESTHDRFPVIYFFHGWGGRYFKDDNARLEYELLKTLVDKYKVILVMWDGNISEEEPRPYNIGNHSDVKFRIQMKDYFIELIHHVDSSFRTLPDRQHRGIIGFSMGGIISFYLAGKYPDRICAAANLHGSPEFFMGYPERHQLYPVRHTFRNLQDVQLLLHNSDYDELFYLNEEVNKAAQWEGDLNYAYELFEGGHKIDDPGKTVVFEKAMSYVANAFKTPLARSGKWSHYDFYPGFEVWNYKVNSNLKFPGFIFLKDVNRHGFGLYSQKWLPDGPCIDSLTMEILTAPVYSPNTNYNIISIRKSDERTRNEIAESNDQGKLSLQCDGKGYEFGIYQEGDPQDMICLDYAMDNNNRYIIVGQKNKLCLKLFNRGGLQHGSQKAKLILSCPDSSVTIENRELPLILESETRLTLSPPFNIYCNKKAPDDAAPSQIKFTIHIVLKDTVFKDEMIVPVFFDVPAFRNYTVMDRYSPADSLFGTGDGDGIAEPGESIMILVDGHRTRLYSNDPYITADQEQLVTERLPAKWPDGFTSSSVIKIGPDCPEGHVLELLACYETKTYMPIRRIMHWGKVFIGDR
jgi:enterochelin esterase-like enzyme